MHGGLCKNAIPPKLLEKPHWEKSRRIRLLMQGHVMYNSNCADKRRENPTQY